MTVDVPAGQGGRRDLHGTGGKTMVVLRSAPRGRISAARMAARRDEVEEAYGIIIRPPRVTAPVQDAKLPARPRLTVGGES